MENLKFDLTTQNGLIKSQENLKRLVTPSASVGLTIQWDIEGMFKDLTNLLNKFIDRVFDLFDDSKKLEKQMELAIKTIEIAKAAGAKSIEITLNAKNEGGLKVYLKEIDAKVGGKYEKDNTITYTIVFSV